VVVVWVCVVVVQSLTLSEAKIEFKDFMARHQKHYTDEQADKRFQIFKKNLEYIDAVNSRDTGMILGINRFADLSHGEYLSLLKTPRHPKTGKTETPLLPDGALPPVMDWRNKSVVGPVMNTSSCNITSYATVGSAQSFCAIAYGKLQVYDPDQISACIPQDCNTTAESAWKYIIQRGLHVQWNTSCAASTSTPGCCINDYLCFSGTEFALQTSVGIMGPVTVTIDASHPSFQLYKSGIYYEPACNSSNLNLDLLVVGYGNYGKQEFWIAQNTWGPSWGLDGYILMSRNQNNNCGIASHQCHPIAVHQCVRP